MARAQHPDTAHAQWPPTPCCRAGTAVVFGTLYYQSFAKKDKHKEAGGKAVSEGGKAASPGSPRALDPEAQALLKGGEEAEKVTPEK